MSTTRNPRSSRRFRRGAMSALAGATLILGLAASPASATHNDEEPTGDTSSDQCMGEETVVDPFCDGDYDWWEDGDAFDDVWCHLTGDCPGPGGGGGGGGNGGGGGDGGGGHGGDGSGGGDSFCPARTPICEEETEPTRVRTIIVEDGTITMTE